MGEAYWEVTQALLQSGEEPIVRKPRLTDQLLQRPPFRFLHDVVTAVQNRTGFAPGLYTEEELESKAIKDKDKKVAYLTKIIDVVGLSLGTPVPVRPLKVVAGLEPENTNVFLQLLAKASQLGDAQEVVARVLAGEHQSGGVGAASTSAVDVSRPDVGRPASRPSSQHSARLSRQNSSNKSEAAVERAATAALASQPSPPSPSEPPPRVSNAGSDPVSSEADAITTPPPVETSGPKPPAAKTSRRRSSSGDAISSSNMTPVPPAVPLREALGDSPGAEAANAVGLDQGATPFVSEGLKPPLQRRPQRPQSAKRPPPKVKSAEQSAGRKGNSGSGRPPTSSSAHSVGSSQGGIRPKVFVEEEEADNDDEIDVFDDSVNEIAAPAQQHAQRAEGGGALVKDILEVEKRLVEGGPNEGSAGNQEQGIVLQRRRRQQETPSKFGDLEKLREMIQNVCQSVTPLGRCLEFLQEDVEAMGKEARFWGTERKVYQEKVEEVLGTPGDDLGMLQSQIQEVDDQIQQVKDRIMAGKAHILDNHHNITELLMAVSNKGQ